jgi:YidC/Oxa1 family membrane protein insertase
MLNTMSGDDQNDTTSFDDTINKLFADQDTTTAIVDAASASAAQLWDPHWYNLADQAINLIHAFHAASGLNYAYSIIGVTAIARVFLFPIFVKGQRTQSRMAHMQPELQAIKARIDKLGPDADRETQIKYGLQMKALFKKYDCNPLGAMVVPMVQAPFFMSMFFGLTKMPKFFPDELSTGGIFWFQDLTMTDSYYILPSFSALTFLIMIEKGKEQMMATNPAQGEMMVNIFRGMSVIMFPVAIGFSTAVLCYWVTNNTITLVQSLAFQNPTIRRHLGIWEQPKPVPGAPVPKGFMESVTEAAEKVQGKAVSDEDKMNVHNTTVENQKKAAKLSRAARVRRDGRFTRQPRK